MNNDKMKRNKGHTRQGLKCRLCKINVHADCKTGVGRCLPKSNRLMRRQKSTPELETGAVAAAAAEYGDDADAADADVDPRHFDQTYVVLKQANEIAAAAAAAAASAAGGAANGGLHADRRRYPALEVERSVFFLPVVDPKGSTSLRRNSNRTVRLLFFFCFFFFRILATTPTGSLVTSVSASAVGYSDYGVAGGGGGGGVVPRPARPSPASASRAKNPNSLSVGHPSSFHSSSSGEFVINVALAASGAKNATDESRRRSPPRFDPANGHAIGGGASHFSLPPAATTSEMARNPISATATAINSCRWGIV